MQFTYQIEDIQSVADAILKQLTSKTLLFYGDMGSGKTTLIKALSKQLGTLEIVNSPTFSIVNEYEIQNDLIYHFDLYRIENEEEALNFGIEDYLFSDHYVFIEWPERIAHLLPEDYTKITIKLNLDGSRTLYID
ncbi:tRNA (adenosine(37)-N6)-threonylcarbamoyltransferase complex ATPase subunit type 1 TsaE [Gelidibacter salicanalis]|uniref:tRNA threonylcarbamoyladenosine biosynthesis protein TsaE n=1 Tax=Gelidibacter salicanalis TaxID=291193 RepID=A0A934NEH4_9FLAO|nr:tRNA (adenosine(37)-N6)-threonylcarbamoyltransferase complex ATPase subunit type 1 TsaE [Gelidibacter salicanalis]MBJ7882720.1 tRNA (adenosine(37)-N6)-threonylcarbamoyltransferase complex ATPase subunit type 1 TsaE [Gelidibacter salicanalis]